MNDRLVVKLWQVMFGPRNYVGQPWLLCVFSSFNEKISDTVAVFLDRKYSAFAFCFFRCLVIHEIIIVKKSLPRAPRAAPDSHFTK